MKTRFALVQKALLFMARAMLVLIGTLILASPVEFYASNGIELGANVSLLNETRAPAGILLAAGLVQAASLEAVIGLTCLAVLLARRAPAKEVA